MGVALGRIRLSEQIEDAILSAIQSGQYPAGSKLPSERVLMEMFDVKRTSIKEALLMLEQKGFVKLKRGVAPIVLEPTPQVAMDAISDIVKAMLPDASLRSEFYELRVILETVAVMEAALQLDKNEILEVEASLEACRNQIGKAKAFRDADQSFHRQLMATQGNSVANALHGALIEWGLYNPQHGPGLDNIHARVVDQHKAIVSAIRAKDPMAAAEALRTHLQTRRNAQKAD